MSQMFSDGYAKWEKKNCIAYLLWDMSLHAFYLSILIKIHSDRRYYHHFTDSLSMLSSSVKVHITRHWQYQNLHPAHSYSKALHLERWDGLDPGWSRFMLWVLAHSEVSCTAGTSLTHWPTEQVLKEASSHVKHCAFGLHDHCTSRHCCSRVPAFGPCYSQESLELGSQWKVLF